MKSISVVIPNYNGKHLFERYFEHNYQIFKSLNTEVEIIVVDDASKDDSVTYLKDKYQDNIILIEKKINSGFSESCNIGIQKASKELTFLLNTDVKLEADYFDKLSKYFEHSDTFGVMGRIIGMNDDVIQDAARSPKLSGRKVKPSHFFYLREGKVLTPTFYLSGAIALMDTAKLKSINGFNELFGPYYGEDQELSIRAWRLGWKCYYEHEAICRHELSASTKLHAHRRRIKRIHFRNRYYLHHLHLSGKDLAFYHAQIFLTDFVFSLLSFQTYKVEAYLDFIRNRRKLTERKNNFSNMMKKMKSDISIHDIISNIKTSIQNERVVWL